MSRGLTSGMETAVSSDTVRPFFLVDLDFSSPIYIWSGTGDLSHGGNTYIGVGDLLGISALQETTDLGAQGVNLILSGIDNQAGTLLHKALTEDYQGKSVEIKLGAFDSSASIIADPTSVFKGFMDVMTIDEGADSATISLAVENKLIILENAKERRYNDEDQKIENSTDKGFEFVASIQDVEIVWGRSTGGGGTKNLGGHPNYAR